MNSCLLIINCKRQSKVWIFKFDDKNVSTAIRTVHNNYKSGKWKK